MSRAARSSWVAEGRRLRLVNEPYDGMNRHWGREIGFQATVRAGKSHFVLSRKRPVAGLPSGGFRRLPQYRAMPVLSCVGGVHGLLAFTRGRHLAESVGGPYTDSVSVSALSPGTRLRWFPRLGLLWVWCRGRVRIGGSRIVTCCGSGDFGV